MEKRVALMGVMVENKKDIAKLNELLHEHSEYIIGRMGIPHASGDISIISVAMEAPEQIICALSGKIGMLKGIHSKVIYAKNTKKY